MFKIAPQELSLACAFCAMLKITLPRSPGVFWTPHLPKPGKADVLPLRASSYLFALQAFFLRLIFGIAPPWEVIFRKSKIFEMRCIHTTLTTDREAEAYIVYV